MSRPIDQAEVAHALARVSALLDHDGYTLDVGVVEERVVLSIHARDGACADCLVPERSMCAMVLAELDGAGYALTVGDVELIYPDSTSGTSS